MVGKKELGSLDLLPTDPTLLVNLSNCLKQSKMWSNFGWFKDLNFFQVVYLQHLGYLGFLRHLISKANTIIKDFEVKINGLVKNGDKKCWGGGK